ncbi:hypothetical protein GWK48_09040 [Metallosphaera tengchongensis]|uniref:Uncharacterized protein n=1 Tax=Metallosphaera tengchongensis TaxID=1532350 RepID=A0A6N0NWA8_9CREN|nr:hypothetical protein [Metallosphaera tengchongensis]QKR00497.1 hypothetical protein GWK48_09040 [Metallosphaera tengchongensis]
MVQESRAYFYFQKKVAGLDKLKARAEKVHETEARGRVLREGVFKRLYRRLLDYYRSFYPLTYLKRCGVGVSTVYLGYPYFISQDRGNKST